MTPLSMAWRKITSGGTGLPPRLISEIYILVLPRRRYSICPVNLLLFPCPVLVMVARSVIDVLFIKCRLSMAVVAPYIYKGIISQEPLTFNHKSGLPVPGS